MKINSIIIVVFLMTITCKTNLNGQVKLGLFSHSEFFYSPNESYDTLKSFYKGYNKSSFSSNLGIAINYRMSDRISIAVGLQRANRQFDCDCVNAIARIGTVYYIANSSCELRLKAKYKILQMPLSIKYSFPTEDKKISHSLGISNTFVYSLGLESLIYDNSGSVFMVSDGRFISFFSPEVYYELDVNLSKYLSANFTLGVREEITKQVNHAVFGKLGMGYSFGKMPKSKRKRK